MEYKTWHKSPYGCKSYQKSLKTSRNRPVTACRVISRNASLKPQGVDKVNQNKHEKVSKIHSRPRVDVRSIKDYLLR